MDFQGNGAFQLNKNVYTYTQPGNYNLIINYTNLGPDTIRVTVEDNIQPNFEIYSCSGTKASIKITDQTYDQYFVDFGDGSSLLTVNKSISQVAQHNYGSTTPVTIKINGKKNNAANNCSPKAQSFTPVTSLTPPSINQLVAVDAVTLKLDFTPPVNTQYKLEMATNNLGFLQLQSLYGVGTVTVNNLNLNNNYYRLRLSAYDPCVFRDTYSPIIASHKFAATATNNQISLDWQTNATASDRIDINRNESPYFLNLSGSLTTKVDPDVTCREEYSYQLITKYGWGGSSFSLKKAVTAFSTDIPTPITNASSVVGNGGVKIDWLQPSSFTATTYSILRGAGFNFYDNSTTPSYTDRTFAVGLNQCYQINYVDKCDNRSPNSNAICPIQLTGELSNENKVTLNWNPYTGWNLGVRAYQIIKYDQNGNQIATIDRGLNLSYTETDTDLLHQVVSYKIIAKPIEAGIQESESNQIQLNKSVNLFFPTAFTPDRKGPIDNETFKVQGQFIKRLELSVFDRWGAVVFYTDKDEAWDGTQNGQPMPITTYVWVANITDLSGKTYQRSGTVVLMRK